MRVEDLSDLDELHDKFPTKFERDNVGLIGDKMKQ